MTLSITTPGIISKYHYTILTIVTRSVASFYCYTERHYAERRYAKCHYAECHGARQFTQHRMHKRMLILTYFMHYEEMENYLSAQKLFFHF
jgi:hypothetical protein